MPWHTRVVVAAFVATLLVALVCRRLRIRRPGVGHDPSKGRGSRFIASSLLSVVIWLQPVAAQSPPEDVLARSIALYPTLAAYADTGAVVREVPGIVDRWKFRTYFRRASLDFLFDFQGVTSQSAGLTTDASNQRIVLWMINGELQSYNQVVRSHETVPRDSGNQPAALHNASASTAGTSILIPSLIFSRANLPGTILQIEQATDEGFDTVAGRRCHKVTGRAVEYYQSGRKTNIRPVTVWIDAESLLIRKVFEDTPEGYPAGSYSRLTVTIDPQANPVLDESKFEFTVPLSQQ